MTKAVTPTKKPAHEVAIAPFDMAVYPMTNAEYRLFIQANGYENEQWWETEAARAWLRGEGSNTSALQQGRDYQKYLQDFSEQSIQNANASPDQIEFWLWLRKASDEERDQQYEKWYPSGKIYRQPEYWDDSRFNHQSQPVVGTSWFEARAYCAWLSAQTGAV
ncbi:MAG: SUMF1/EgtB/PvdO family nonheme iron enzyme [Chloroflexi bacterium]|nr:SUMF1/EgtB/PvdO family nonheme iron enzyme [Chloroflexota bacterium]